MRSAGYAAKGSRLFFLFGGVRVVLDFCCCSHQVLNTFPSHCQINLLSWHVPQVPNVFPTAPAFCPICLLSSWNLYSWVKFKTYVVLCLEWIFLHWGCIWTGMFDTEIWLLRNGKALFGYREVSPIVIIVGSSVLWRHILGIFFSNFQQVYYYYYYSNKTKQK